MKTKTMMMAAAGYFILAGLGFTFLPEEIIRFFGAQANRFLLLIFQLLGATYMGLGMMSWVSRNSLVGGIYNRPLVLGNFLYFLLGAFASVKTAMHYSGDPLAIYIPIAVLHIIFALYFVYLLRVNPQPNKQ
ncbi:hypothetical protein [Parapedobacter sp.]